MRTSKEIYDALVEDIEKQYFALRQLLRVASDKPVVSSLSQLRRTLIHQQTLTDQLYQIAITDGLTGLKTRGYLESVILDELKNESKLGYLIIDIDHFKPYNDTFGHRQGDIAIQETAKVIERNAAAELVARYGGEEFALFLLRCNKNTDLQRRAASIRYAVRTNSVQPFSPSRIVNKILRRTRGSDVLTDEQHFASTRARLERFLKTRWKPVEYDAQLRRYFGCGPIANCVRQLQHLTVSIGGHLRLKGETILETMDMADEALYEAKKHRDCVVIA